MSQWINKKRNKKGFTLIELVVVIAILGILAAVAIPRLTGAQDKARNNTHDSNLATLKSAGNIAVAEHGNPTAEIEWSSKEAGAGLHLKDSYVDTWPKSPWSGGPDYILTISTEGVVDVSGGKSVAP